MPWDHNATNYIPSKLIWLRLLPLKQEVTSSKHWGPPSIDPLSSTADRPGCDRWHQWLSGSPVLHNSCYLFYLDSIKGTLQYNNQNLSTMCNKAITKLHLLTNTVSKLLVLWENILPENESLIVTIISCCKPVIQCLS